MPVAAAVPVCAAVSVPGSRGTRVGSVLPSVFSFRPLVNVDIAYVLRRNRGGQEKQDEEDAGGESGEHGVGVGSGCVVRACLLC